MDSMAFGIALAELSYENTFPLMSDSAYEPHREESFAAQSSESNQSPESCVYDYLAQDERNMVIVFFSNYSDYNLNAVREMQLDDSTVTGLSDEGAHVSLIFDAVNPTYQLSYWTRDRARGETLPLAHVIHRATRRNAELFGFADRRLLVPGMKADLNVIDYENLKPEELKVVNDLSAGGARIMQGASGYLATLIDSVVTWLKDEDTGVRPGRLLRS